MKRIVHVFFFLTFALRHLLQAQEIAILSELPFTELLTQKKILQGRTLTEDVPPVASPLIGDEHSHEEISFKGISKFPNKKTFYEEDYDDDKGHLHKKKHGDKMHDILNTSITALSYLAFGGYLLCMIANAMREKRRRIMMAFPSAGPTMSNQFAHVLQHYVNNRPARPFIRFPTVTVHQGGRRRRREVPEMGPKRPSSPFEI